MPELKKGSAANALEAFVASTLEPDSVRFKDKTREEQRQQVRGRGGGGVSWGKGWGCCKYILLITSTAGQTFRVLSFMCMSSVLDCHPPPT
jgi:hypothetical protein